MSAIQSPSPNNMLLLAALGIGTYYVLSRRATAATAAPAAAAGAPRAGPLESLVNLAGSLRGLFGGTAAPAPGTGSGAFLGAGVPSGVPSWDDAFRRALASSGTDGLAINPVYSAPVEFIDYGAYL